MFRNESTWIEDDVVRSIASGHDFRKNVSCKLSHFNNCDKWEVVITISDKPRILCTYTYLRTNSPDCLNMKGIIKKCRLSKNKNIFLLLVFLLVMMTAGYEELKERSRCRFFDVFYCLLRAHSLRACRGEAQIDENMLQSNSLEKLCLSSFPSYLLKLNLMQMNFLTQRKGTGEIWKHLNVSFRLFEENLLSVFECCLHEVIIPNNLPLRWYKKHFF